MRLEKVENRCDKLSNNEANGTESGRATRGDALRRIREKRVESYHNPPRITPLSIDAKKLLTGTQSSRPSLQAEDVSGSTTPAQTSTNQ